MTLACAFAIKEAISRQLGAPAVFLKAPRGPHFLNRRLAYTTASARRLQALGRAHWFVPTPQHGGGERAGVRPPSALTVLFFFSRTPRDYFLVFFLRGVVFLRDVSSLCAFLEAQTVGNVICCPCCIVLFSDPTSCLLISVLPRKIVLPFLLDRMSCANI